MDREAAVRNLSSEVEALIRLHQQGLYNSSGYQARRKKIEELIREQRIDLRKELDPVTQILYRRYLS